MDILFSATRKYQAKDKARRMPIKRTLTSFFKRKRYTRTETHRFDLRDSDGDRFKRFSAITFRGTLAQIRTKRIKWVASTIKRFTDSDVTVFKHAIIAGTYVSLDKPLSPLAIPLEDIHALDIDGCVPAHDYQIGETSCVADFLRHRYPDRIKCLPDGPLTSYEILRLCQANRISLRVFDHDTQQILEHEAPKTKPKRTPPLYYKIKNGHMYPLTEKTAQSIRNSNRKNAKKSKVAPKQQPKNFSFNNIESPPLEYLVRKMELAHKEPSKITLCKDIIRFEIDDTSYVCKSWECCQPMRKYCKANDIEYTGQHSPVPFAKPISAVARPSTFNDQVYSVFKQCDRTITHMGRITEIYPADCEVIDLVKCHRRCLLGPLQDWFVFSTLDEFKRHKTFKNIPGFYVTKSKDITLLRGDGLYTNTILQHAKKHGIAFTVTHILQPSDTQPKNLFQEPVEAFMKTNGDTKFKKSVVNRVAGLLGVFHQPSFNLKVNTDFQQVCNDIHKYDQDKIMVQKINDYWVYGREIKNRAFNTTRPMYLQILEQANIELFNVAKRITSRGGTIHFRYSDELHYTGCEPMEETTTDCHKPSNIHEPGNYDLELPNEYDFDIPTKPQWDDQLENDSSQDIATKLLEGGCIQGAGGVGKTHVLRCLTKLLTEQKKTYQCLALTNTAAKLIDGKTMHSFWSMEAGAIKSGRSIQEYTMPEYLIVDEMSMIPKLFYNILNEAKTVAKCKVILLGDFHQIPPINEHRFDHKNSFVIKYLTDYKLWRLTKNYRAHDGLPAFLTELPDLPNDVIHTKVLKTFQKSTDQERMYEAWNIGFNNLAHNDGLKINTTLNDGHARLRGVLTTDRFRLVENMRVICNTKCDEIPKNTILRVDRYTKGTVTLADGEDTTDIDETTFWKKFDMAYCITIEKAQGQTLSGDVFIHQLDKLLNNKSDYKKCYTALGRATSMQNIFIATLQ